MKIKPANGFTLLELLLAISLVGMIVASISGGMHLGRRVWETGKASESLDELETAVRTVSMFISKAKPILISDVNAPADPPKSLLTGSSNMLRFPALSEGNEQWGGLIITDIGVDQQGSNSELTIWTTVLRYNSGSVDANRSMMRKASILTDISNFRLGYYGVIEKDHAPTWVDSWPSRPFIPLLISVSITAKRLGRLIEVSSIVALRQQ